MTRRERTLRAIAHKETNIIPHNIDFTMGERDKMVQYYGDPNFEEKIDNHLQGLWYGESTEIRPGFVRDMFGVVWNRSGADKDIGVIDDVLIPDADLSSYIFPTVNETAIRRGYEALLSDGKDTLKFGSIGFSMFERAWTLCGMENLLCNMVLEPTFVHQLLDEICECNLKMIDIGMSYDIDAFYFGDDWGQQKGLIMGEKLWREFIKPRMARMYQRVKSKGKAVIQHSCGDIVTIFPDLIEIGLDVYQTFQPEIYNIVSVKKEFGKDLTFFGGISTQALLPYATPQEVESETRRIMEIMGKGGGYIVAPTHAVPADVPAENMDVLIKVFQNQ